MSTSDPDTTLETPLLMVHNYYGTPILKFFNVDDYAAQVKKLNVNTVHWEATYLDQYARYKSALVPVHPDIGNRDLLKEVTEKLHAEKIRILAYLNAHLMPDWMAKEHPAWVQLKSDRQPLLTYADSMMSNCPNGPWRDYSFEVIREILKGYDVDGIFLDGPAFFEGTCYCDSCQRKFRASFEKDIPYDSASNTLLWRKFVKWRFDCINEYLKDAQAAARSINPHKKLYMNATGWGHVLWPLARDVSEMSKYEDIVGAEAFMYFPGVAREVIDLWLRGATAKFLVAAARGKPCVVFTTFGANRYYYYPIPSGTVKSAIFQTVANGAGVWLEMAHPLLTNAEKEAQVVSESYGFIRAKKEYFSESTSAANVALLWSRQSMDWQNEYLRGDQDWTVAGAGKDGDKKDDRADYKDEQDYKLSVWGMYDTLIREYVPFDLILDKDLNVLERLKKYDTLILGNSLCLSEKQCDNIRAFVKEGGGVVVWGDASLCDENGVSRPSMALADVFGINGNCCPTMEQTFPPPNYVYNKRKDHPVMDDIRQVLPAPKMLFKVIPESENDVISWMMDNRSTPVFDSPLARQMLLGNIQLYCPAIICRSYDKGRVFYFAGDMGQLCWKQPFPEWRRIVKNAVKWVSRGNLPLDIQNGGFFEVVLRFQKIHNRYILHLINYTAGMVHPTDKMVSLSDIRIQLNTQVLGKIRRMVSVTRSTEINLRKVDDKWMELLLPRLDDYELLEIFL